MAELEEEINLLNVANGECRKMIRRNTARIEELRAQLDTLRARDTDAHWKTHANEMSCFMVWNTFGCKTTYAVQTDSMTANVYRKGDKGLVYLRINERGDVMPGLSFSKRVLFNIYRLVPSEWASMYAKSS